MAHATRRASDSGFRQFLAGWLPTIVVLGGGFMAWGAFSQKLDDTIRRVGGSEAVISSLQDKNSEAAQRLSRIEAKLDSVVELLRPSFRGTDFQPGERARSLGPQ